MNKFLSIILILSPAIAFSLPSTIICYSHGKVIYKGNTNDIRYGDGVFMFYTSKKNIVFIRGECIVKILGKNEK
jgi:hypothetical protein